MHPELAHLRNLPIAEKLRVVEELLDDVMYRIYVRQEIEAGLRDVENGAPLTTGDVRKRFGLSDSGSQ